ncbi:MAG: ABC transporter permease subunit [Oscillospiraceae bacterium]|jgi:sodium transport system permease protein|nr:ABC transporter permease subunit [Oscillospiraceae bacterium]
MNKNIVTIIRKEFARFFGDKRLILTTLILPGLMIYVMYSVMGDMASSLVRGDAEHIPVMNAVNMPDSIAPRAAEYGFDVVAVTDSDVPGIKEQLKNSEADVLVIFPEGFDASVEAYDAKLSSAYAPNIEIYYNSLRPESLSAYGIATAMLDEYERSIANKFDYNYGIVGDLVTIEDAASFSMSMLLPMLLMIFMVMGCLALAPESLAGEKERGTIATLLVTPIKRSDLAIGKIISLGVLAFLCGLSSALGTVLSLPKLMNVGDSGAANEMGSAVANLFAPLDILLLVLIILSTILLVTTLMSIISTLAKSVKEATTAVMPLYLLVMLLSVSSVFGKGSAGNSFIYLIPLYNTLQSLIGIVSGEYVALNAVINVVSNLVYAVIGSFALTKMFSSEKVMFSK